MKKIKKIKLEKETIVNLNDNDMLQLKGGSVSEWISTYVSEKIIEYTASMTASILKENTFWVGCTTDPRYSKAPGQPGCVPA
ncbi:TIGR04149 family rSAM-modified RiPP [Sphingobacterium thalpophilum]|uniref:Natural product, GG-Bacteroidales family n=1 Tax=Sphingobacterium thalpophilum TaxID=259 RepID=A0A4U9VZ49_9SPHI|nr:TIGR04149 family rSAM-modified RiPP [Sphingobacterium thalpophilum]VTR49251.1 natural product precursor, GG-Bacteroidales family [Sphingobacterium thalpophilum]